jgi:Outer membrane protein beta-barrel domain
MKRPGMMTVAGALIGLWLLPSAPSAAELKGGLKVGLNLSCIHGKDSEYFSGHFFEFGGLRLGFCAGGFVAVSLSDSVAIQAEALYTTKGCVEWFESYNRSLHLTYLEFPLLMRLMTPSSHANRLFLLAGPAVGINLKGYLKIYEGEPAVTVEGLKKSDLGLVVGVGLIRQSRALVELRYTFGLKKIIEQGGTALDIKNGAFSVIAGFLF